MNIQTDNYYGVKVLPDATMASIIAGHAAIRPDRQLRLH
jgi:hypothetical protein